jgi:hypothetical protein
MSKRKGKLRVPSDADEARIAAGIAADPDNPEWTAEDFRRAKPFAEMFPALAKTRRARGPQRKPTKIAASLRLMRRWWSASRQADLIRAAALAALALGLSARGFAGGLLLR